MISRLTHGLTQAAIAIDQLANAVLMFGNLGTFADETLSARAWRQSREGQPRRWVIFRQIVDVMFLPQDLYLYLRGTHPGQRHCERAFHNERVRKGLPAEYRDAQ